MKPIELQTIEQESEAHEPVYANLQAAEQALKTARDELERHRKAYTRAGSIAMNNSDEIRELRREQVDRVTQGYLNDDNTVEKYITETNRCIADLDAAIVTNNAVFTRLAGQIPQLEAGVEAARKGYASLTATVETYEKGKTDYIEIYTRAHYAKERSLLQTSAESGDLARRAQITRNQLTNLARTLGCEDDCNAFLQDLEVDTQ